ncbi:MAG: NAD(P)H-hydrate dehydratase, partial [Deferribacteraceae bacterium]|nr:NAD(P)H-hydrate dehydratase [Deferribacteraceae bacterium]
GEVVTAEIGIPDAAVEAVKPSLILLTEYCTPPMPERKGYGHKGNYGHAVIIGGSAGKYGAAVISSRAALRAGAGLVTCALPNLAPLLSFPEIMGFNSGDNLFFTADSAEAVAGFCREKSAAAIGPGLSRSPESLEFAGNFILSSDIPLVIDADALFALDRNTLKAINGRAILTPHIGEFANMLGIDKSVTERNKLQLAMEYAVQNGVYLILKSSETIISAPDGQQYISVWGTPALSKGGSGDILTGILTALIAQGIRLADACKLACRIQGDAAGTAQKSRGAFAVTAEDILNSIGLLP